jgi:HD-like signal output (HDOD) protein
VPIGQKRAEEGSVHTARESAQPIELPTIDELLQEFSEISGHHLLIARINSLLNNDSSGVQDLVAILKLDAGLSARVILAANTVYFHSGARIGSIDEAVFRVGQWEVKRLLLNSIAFELTGGPLRAYGIPRGEAWNHSLACALAMESLAREVDGNSDACYTIGLMYPLGLVIVDRWLSQHGFPKEEVLGEPGTPRTSSRERKVIGHTSEFLAGVLLSRWNFPDLIVATVSHQDTPFEAGEFRQTACLLAIARWQAARMLADLTGRPGPNPPGAAMLRSAGVDASLLLGNLETLRARFLENKTFVGVL